MKRKILSLALLALFLVGCSTNSDNHKTGAIIEGDYELQYDIYVEDGTFLTLEFALIYEGEEIKVDVFPVRATGENPFIYYVEITDKDNVPLKLLAFKTPEQREFTVTLEQGVEHTFAQRISIIDVKEDIKSVTFIIDLDEKGELIRFEKKLELN